MNIWFNVNTEDQVQGWGVVLREGGCTETSTVCVCVWLTASHQDAVGHKTEGKLIPVMVMNPVQCHVFITQENEGSRTEN